MLVYSSQASGHALGPLYTTQVYLFCSFLSSTCSLVEYRLAMRNIREGMSGVRKTCQRRRPIPKNRKFATHGVSSVRRSSWSPQPHRGTAIACAAAAVTFEAAGPALQLGRWRTTAACRYRTAVGRNASGPASPRHSNHWCCTCEPNARCKSCGCYQYSRADHQIEFGDKREEFTIHGRRRRPPVVDYSYCYTPIAKRRSGPQLQKDRYH